MKSKWVIAVIISAMVLSGCGAGGFRSLANGSGTTATGTDAYVTVESAPLTVIIGATGTVRAAQSALIPWQASGNVGDVSAKIGDLVMAGQELASLDPTSLSQSLLQARVDLINAQKNLEDLKKSDPLEIAQAESAVDQAEQTLSDLQNPSAASLAQAEIAVLDAKDALTKANNELKYLTSGRGTEEEIATAQANYLLAQDRVNHFQDIYENTPGAPDSSSDKAAALSNLAGAKGDRDRAYSRLSWFESGPDPVQIAERQADVDLASAKFADAEQALADLKQPSELDISLAKAKLLDAQDKLEKLLNGPSQDDLTVAQTRVIQAQANRDQAHITAPFDSTVTDVNVLPGDVVSAGRTAFRVDDLSKLFIDLQVSEIDIHQIQVGQTVNITLDAILDGVYNGEVTQIGWVGTNNQGAVYFTVTIRILDPDTSVLPGMTAVADIQVAQLDNVLQLPNRAIQDDNGKRFVYLAEQSGDTVTLKQVYVQIGASSDTASEIISTELKAGDQVSVVGPDQMFGGQMGGGAIHP
jgi:HlyD family secretion protein